MQHLVAQKGTPMVEPMEHKRAGKMDSEKVDMKAAQSAISMADQSADRKERQWVGYLVGWMVVRWVEQ